MATIEELNRGQLRCIVGFAADTLSQAMDFAISNGFMSDADLIEQMIGWSKIVGRPLSTETIPPAPQSATAAPAIATPAAHETRHVNCTCGTDALGACIVHGGRQEPPAIENLPAGSEKVESAIGAPAAAGPDDANGPAARQSRKRRARRKRNGVTTPVPPLERDSVVSADVIPENVSVDDRNSAA